MIGKDAPRLCLALCAILAGGVTTAAAWGDRTHPFVNGLALEALPAGPAAFFEPHRRDLQRRSNEPDSVLRAREGRAEKIRHYIDLDAHMPPPFSGFPRFYPEAEKRFGRRNLEKNGVLPWVILRFQRQLKEALARGDVEAWVREAAYLGHYVADAYQPLHLTENHDGQKSGQKGIHRRFENGLVDERLERYGAEARKLVKPAVRLADPRDAVFTELFASYAGVAEILQADQRAREKSKVGSADYYRALDRDLGPLAARQIAAAASMLAALWLTAWEEAKS
jgi:hypothetical protein